MPVSRPEPPDAAPGTPPTTERSASTRIRPRAPHPSGRAPRVHRDHLRITARILIAVGFATLIIAGAQAQHPPSSHGTFEELESEEAVFRHYAAPGQSSTTWINVKEDFALAKDRYVMRAQADHLVMVIPGLGPQDHLYALRIQVISSDPAVEPLVLWARPGAGAAISEPRDEWGNLEEHGEFALTEAGAYRLVTSSETTPGPLEVRIEAMVAPPQAPVLHPRALASIGGAAFMAALALSVVRLTSGAEPRAPRKHDANDMEPVDFDDMDEHAPESQGPAFGRMEPRVAGTPEWELAGDGVPEEMARRRTRGWIIRLE